VFVYGASKEFVSSMVENAKEDYQQRLNHETMLAYIAAYFLLWYSGCLCVRYVKKAPK
jgi:hypothetical protein